MKLRLTAAVAILLSVAGVASAHRLDEYLQATILSVDKDHVQASMRLIPGVSVSSSVIADIDTNHDGVLSAAEQAVYADRVLSDLSLTIDGKHLKLHLLSADFPSAGQMREGLGEIHLEFTADLPRGGRNRRLILENHHQNRNAVYLVNCLVPRDPDIQITAQNRNEQQSYYQLDYVQSGITTTPPVLNSLFLNSWARLNSSLHATGFASLFHLGMRHIVEGTDHLLFLLALLLPAPLIASGSRWADSRWAGPVGTRRSLLRILKIVTAFTIGHSLTLALAATGLVHIPSRPIEVLIAFSILVSAIHALHPLFPGKESWIAAFFGLIHGLAFAATLGDLGLDWWPRVNGILAFNLGIETVQLTVVALTLPSLLIVSRTSAYQFLRVGGALFAAIASVGWIAERLSGMHSSVDLIVNSIAHHAIWIAGAMLLVSLCSLRLRNARNTLGQPVAAGVSSIQSPG